jgi:hypothetical protein
VSGPIAPFGQTVLFSIGQISLLDERHRFVEGEGINLLL